MWRGVFFFASPSSAVHSRSRTTSWRHLCVSAVQKPRVHGNLRSLAQFNKIICSCCWNNPKESLWSSHIGHVNPSSLCLAWGLFCSSRFGRIFTLQVMLCCWSVISQAIWRTFIECGRLEEETGDKHKHTHTQRTPDTDQTQPLKFAWCSVIH